MDPCRWSGLVSAASVDRDFPTLSDLNNRNLSSGDYFYFFDMSTFFVFGKLHVTWFKNIALRKFT